MCLETVSFTELSHKIIEVFLVIVNQHSDCLVDIIIVVNVTLEVSPVIVYIIKLPLFCECNYFGKYKYCSISCDSLYHNIVIIL